MKHTSLLKKSIPWKLLQEQLNMYWLIAVIGSLCLFLLSSCSQFQKNQSKVKDWLQSDPDIIKVLATTSHVGSIVRQVGGDKIAVLELIQGENDPHSYQLVKGDDEKFLAADVVFYSGLGLEHGPSLVSQLKNIHAVSYADEIEKQFPGSAIVLGSSLDPHMWMDVSLWARGVFVIARVLSEKRPDKKEYFELRAQQVYEKLMALDQCIYNSMHEIPSQKRYLVTTHDAFNYFARRYLADDKEFAQSKWNIRCKAPEGLAPDSQISTQDIVEIANFVIAHKVAVLFAEIGINHDSLAKLKEVLQEKEHTISVVQEELYSDSMGPIGTNGETYEGMIRYNASIIRRNLYPEEKNNTL